ncbi:MAG: ABC transporter permease [Elusimicrobiota bacterium]
MTLPFEVFVALRYLKSKRKGLFTVVTTAIGVAGVSIGVAALIIILSVMNGFQADIQKKVIGAQAHITIDAQLDAAKLKRVETVLAAHPEVEASAPFALGQGILTFEGRSSGVVVKGIDPEAEFKVNDLAKTLTSGGWERLGEGKVPGVVLGEELARSMGVWLGEDIILVSPPRNLGITPLMKRFKVVGLLRTGYYEYDNIMVYTSRPAAAAFLEVPGGATGVQVKVARLELADEVCAALRQELGFEYRIRSYSQMNETLFAALKLEKIMMFIIVTLIILVASFNIASNLILMGTEKLRDIGLLRAMGATGPEILRVFLWVGSLIGALGVCSGTAIGLAVCWFLHRYPIIQLPSDIYYLTRLPVQVSPSDVASVVLCGLALSVLATLYPAWRSSRVDPIEAIHYG